MTQSPVERYREILAPIGPLDDQAFHDALTLARSGDDAAARAISGPCLKLACEIADQWAREHPGKNASDVVQEANAGLIEAIRRFRGYSVSDFLNFARETIRGRLDEAFGPE